MEFTCDRMRPRSRPQDDLVYIEDTIWIDLAANAHVELLVLGRIGYLPQLLKRDRRNEKVEISEICADRANLPRLLPQWLVR